MTTKQLDELAAETAAYSSTIHHDYSILAARIAISNLHKETNDTFSGCVQQLFECDGKHLSVVSSVFNEFCQANREALDAMVVTDRDYDFDFFGFKTLEKSYLLKVNGRIVERPQYLFLRTAVAIHMPNMERIRETYDYMSRRIFIHATPTLFNAGTRKQQLSSCFLLTVDDSIESIYSTLMQCALLSKSAGGIGLSIHSIRASNSYIAGTNGVSNGIVPMLKVYNDTARYVDQGGGKRKGAFAIYLEPWHADIEDFLELKKNHGKEEHRARDLFYALWVPDLFMRRVESNGTWTLFCPNEAKGLADVYGVEFEELYARYEREGKGRKTV